MKSRKTNISKNNINVKTSSNRALEGRNEIACFVNVFNLRLNNTCTTAFLHAKTLLIFIFFCEIRVKTKITL